VVDRFRGATSLFEKGPTRRGQLDVSATFEQLDSELSLKGMDLLAKRTFRNRCVPSGCRLARRISDPTSQAGTRVAVARFEPKRCEGGGQVRLVLGPHHLAWS
jgi:hypothetical protein